MYVKLIKLNDTYEYITKDMIVIAYVLNKSLVGIYDAITLFHTIIISVKRTRVIFRPGGMVTQLYSYLIPKENILCLLSGNVTLKDSTRLLLIVTHLFQ